MPTPAARLTVRLAIAVLLAVTATALPACAGKRSVAKTSYIDAFRSGDYEVARREAAIDARSGATNRRDQAALIAGLSAHRLGDDIDAKMWLEPLINNGNDDIAGRANATLGLIARERRDNGLAAARFADAAQRLAGDDRARAHLYAGEALERLGRPHAAKVHYAAAESHASESSLTDALRVRLDDKAYVVQLGAFSQRRRAEELARKAEATAISLGVDKPRIVPIRADGGALLYLVHVGRFVTRTEAESVLPRFGGEGIVTVASGGSSVGPAVARSW